jgi:hypothetical protein
VRKQLTPNIYWLRQIECSWLPGSSKRSHFSVVPAARCALIPVNSRGTECPRFPQLTGVNAADGDIPTLIVGYLEIVGLADE